MGITVCNTGRVISCLVYVQCLVILSNCFRKSILFSIDVCKHHQSAGFTRSVSCSLACRQRFLLVSQRILMVTKLKVVVHQGSIIVDNPPAGSSKVQFSIYIQCFFVVLDRCNMVATVTEYKTYVMQGTCNMLAPGFHSHSQ